MKNFARGRKVQGRKIKSFNAPIIAQDEAKGKRSGYQKLINFVISGDLESARNFIEKAGYSGILAEFLLGNAELDAKLETLAAVIPAGGQDA